MPAINPRTPHMSQAPNHYIGNELDLFQHARNWKAYVRDRVRPFLVGDVLEVGAGFGGTTRVLCDGRQRSWTALEPDSALAARMHQEAARESFALPVEIITGTLGDLAPERRFDAILYMDVLEHIEHDAEEMRRAAARLRPGGTIVVLSPAHQWLFSEFDARLGHFRRYTTSTLAAVGPPGLRRERLEYLDSIGILLSAGNRLLLHRDTPSADQILFWDRRIVPISRRLDPLTGFRLGKSVLGVWRSDRPR